MSKARQLTPTKSLRGNPARRQLFGSPKKQEAGVEKVVSMPHLDGRNAGGEGSSCDDAVAEVNYLQSKDL